MNAANISGTYSMKSDEDFVRVFATLRFVGDDLDPDEISRILEARPTKAHRKGEKFVAGPRSPEAIGKTGIWYLSTRRRLESPHLSDHLEKIIAIIFPFADEGQRLRRLRNVMKTRALEAHVSVFWRGPSTMTAPSIPRHIVTQLGRIPADIEKDFDFL